MTKTLQGHRTKLKKKQNKKDRQTDGQTEYTTRKNRLSDYDCNRRARESSVLILHKKVTVQFVQV